MRIVFLAFAVALVAVPAAAQPPQPSDRSTDQVLMANADGSWTITRDISEAPQALARETDGLVFAEDDPATGDAQRMRRSEAERAAEEAFEEAVEWSRGTEPQ